MAEDLAGAWALLLTPQGCECSLPWYPASQLTPPVLTCCPSCASGMSVTGMSHWAAWYITRLLIKLTPKGVVFSFLFCECAVLYSRPSLKSLNHANRMYHSACHSLLKPIHLVYQQSAILFCHV